MAANKGRPGVMVYFDIRPGLESLTFEEKGLLFDAIMDYAELGILPTFSGNAGLRIAWGFIQPRIDSDAVRYETIRQRRSQAASKRWSKEDDPGEDIQMHATDTSACTHMQAMPTQHNPTTTQLNSSTTTTQRNSTQPAPASVPGKEDLPAGVSRGRAAIERFRSRQSESDGEEDA